LSKTKKAAKLTSEISSSARITGAVFCVAISPVAIEADAPPASDKAPATPNAVTSTNARYKAGAHELAAA